MRMAQEQLVSNSLFEKVTSCRFRSLANVATKSTHQINMLVNKFPARNAASHSWCQTQRLHPPPQMPDLAAHSKALALKQDREESPALIASMLKSPLVESFVSPVDITPKPVASWGMARSARRKHSEQLPIPTAHMATSSLITPPH